MRRKEYMLDCNWKIYVENAMEAYHISTVHRSTLSRQKGKPSEAQPADGEYCALFKEHKGSRALLAGDPGFPEMDHLQGMAAEGSWYPLMYPSTMFGCTYDCMWWLELHPMGPEKTKLIVGSSFPRSTVARPDFEEVVQNYYKRWGMVDPRRQRHFCIATAWSVFALRQTRAAGARRTAGTHLRKLGAGRASKR